MFFVNAKGDVVPDFNKQGLLRVINVRLEHAPKLQRKASRVLRIGPKAAAWLARSMCRHCQACLQEPRLSSSPKPRSQRRRPG